MIDFDEGKKKRDKKLRKRLLMVLHSALNQSPTGELSGPGAMDLAALGAYGDQGFEDEAHALRLARELVNKGLITERIIGLVRGERFDLRHTAYRITDKGSSLFLETAPPDPDVDDRRHWME
jgi:hypothetical protein